MAIITFIIVTDKTFLSLCAVALVFAHEMGHVVAAKILKTPIHEINFCAMSIDIQKPPNYYQKSFIQKMAIILSGCIFNLFIFIILSGIYMISENKFIILAALQSLAIGAVNILPIESLDGGEAVNLILGRHLNYERAQRISSILSLIFLMCLAFLGIFLIIKSGRNVSVVLLALYLIFQKYFI